jgi:hypothetical protein
MRGDIKTMLFENSQPQKAGLCQHKKKKILFKTKLIEINTENSITLKERVISKHWLLNGGDRLPMAV